MLGVQVPSLTPPVFPGSILKKELSVVIPIYNERENIEPLYRSLKSVLDGLGKDYEIVYVDDGSTDGSSKMLEELAEKDPKVTLFKFQENRGESAALDAGIRYARGDVIVTMDGDCQNDPEDIPKLLSRLGEFDVVCGYRERRHDTFSRRMASRIANWVRRKCTGDTTRDVGCTFRAFKAKYAKGVRIFTGLHRFIPTLFKLEGAKICEVPVKHHPRVRGKSKYGIWDRAWRALIDLFVVMWMIRKHPGYRIERVIMDGREVNSDAIQQLR